MSSDLHHRMSGHQVSAVTSGCIEKCIEKCCSPWSIKKTFWREVALHLLQNIDESEDELLSWHSMCDKKKVTLSWPSGAVSHVVNTAVWCVSLCDGCWHNVMFWTSPETDWIPQMQTRIRWQYKKVYLQKQCCETDKINIKRWQQTTRIIMI